MACPRKSCSEQAAGPEAWEVPCCDPCLVLWALGTQGLLVRVRSAGTAAQGGTAVGPWPAALPAPPSSSAAPADVTSVLYDRALGSSALCPLAHQHSAKDLLCTWSWAQQALLGPVWQWGREVSGQQTVSSTVGSLLVTWCAQGCIRPPSRALTHTRTSPVMEPRATVPGGPSSEDLASSRHQEEAAWQGHRAEGRMVDGARWLGRHGLQA